MTNRATPEISFVIPLYNEVDVFGGLISAILEVINKESYEFEVILIDDGSIDQTTTKIREVVESDSRFRGIFFSRNFGHQAAITAGLDSARCTKAAFILDGDLQDPPHLFPLFIAELQNGHDIVYGIRKDRKIGWLKAWLYTRYYKILRSVSEIKMPLHAGDFALISRRALDAINRMPEYNRYIRGLRSFVGFKQKGIEYERPGREVGHSKYTWSKLIKLAFNGIFNFSELPIRIITSLGVVTFVVAFVYLCYNLIKKYVFHAVPEGFTALIVLIIMFAGVQLISLGLIGEYVLRIFMEVKKRPLYIIEEEVEPSSDPLI